MVRFKTLTAVVVLAVISAVVGLSSAAGQTDGRKNGRPNVIVITTDDQTVESLRVMGNVNTLLAASGTTFDSSFANFPLCCPWRASFLTGQHSHTNGVVGNNLTNGLLNLNEKKTLPVWLSKAGYSTAFVGKYFNGYGARDRLFVPPGWGEWYAGITMAYFDHTMNHNGKIVRYGGAPSDYQTDVYTRIATKAVRRLAPKEEPFFLWLSYFAPHHGGPTEAGDPTHVKSAVPAPRHKGFFATEQVPFSPAYDEEDVSDKPAWVRRRGRIGPEHHASMEASYRQRLEALLAVDEGIARIVRELEASGELERTLIVFTSDNGFMQGDHRVVDAKEHVYEASIRVPLIMRGPGVPRGARLAQPVTNVDLAPTLVEMTGARAGLTMDGRSLVPLLADPGIEWGRDVLLERGPGTAASGPRLYTAIRTPGWKYVEHVTGEKELYDLANDPFELQSLHADPSRAEMMTELARRLALLRNCRGSAACNPGPALAIEAPDAGGCARNVRVTGADEPRVAYVQFAVNGRTLATVEDAPFVQPLAPPPSGDARVRALAVLTDGRRLTLDAAVRVCV